MITRKKASKMSTAYAAKCLQRLLWLEWNTHAGQSGQSVKNAQNVKKNVAETVGEVKVAVGLLVDLGP